MKYEVRAYLTEDSFDRYTPDFIEDGLTKGQACIAGVTLIYDYAIIKVQSADREEIYIFKEKG